MKKYKNGLLPWLLILLPLVFFPSFATAEQDNLAITIDAGYLNSSDIDIKKALINAALHYQWEIVEHDRNSMLWKYKNNMLKINIDDTLISIFKDERVPINSKWLPRIKKLTLRKLAYYAEVEKARSLID